LHDHTVDFSILHINEAATVFDFADIKFVGSCILEAK